MTREIILAPWAETVPDAPSPMSCEQFEQWPQAPGWRYELVRGKVVRVPVPGRAHGVMQRRVLFALAFFVVPLGLGEVRDAAGFRLSPPGEARGTELVPDAAFVAARRSPTPGTPEYQRAWELAPDLVVELAHPDQVRPEMTRKAVEYVQAGTRQVWILYPQGQEVDVWQHGKQGHTLQTVQAEHQLDGGEVLPGFTHPVAAFFPTLDKRW